MLERILAKLQSYALSLENRTQAGPVFDAAMADYREKKFRSAFPKMREAALLGDKNAMALLGSMYLQGLGTYENGEESLKWLHKAVDAGQTDAIGVLGMAYATGKARIEKNKKLALEYLTQAAQLGDQQSIRMLSMIQNKQGMFRKDF